MHSKVSPNSKANYPFFFLSVVGFLPAVALADEGLFILDDLL